MEFAPYANIPSPRNVHGRTRNISHEPNLRLPESESTPKSRNVLSTRRRLQMKICRRCKAAFRLTDLPAELRVHIYQAALGSENRTHTYPSSTANHAVHLHEQFIPSIQPAIHALRLTSRQIKHEIDIELVRHSKSQIETVIKGLRCPLGYGTLPRIGFTQHKPQSPTQPILAMIPVPKTYEHIQNLQLTAYISDGRVRAVNDGLQAQGLLYTLPVFVRKLTLDLIIPESVTDMEVVAKGVNSLITEFYHAMCDRGTQWRRHTSHRSVAKSKVGIDHVEVFFPMDMECKNWPAWRLHAEYAKKLGLTLRLMVSEDSGMIAGLIFELKREPCRMFALQLVRKLTKKLARK